LRDDVGGRSFLNFPVSDLRSDSSWTDVYRWLGEKLSLVYEKVLPRLREEMDRDEAASGGSISDTCPAPDEP
jgi:hypothetical protein